MKRRNSFRNSGVDGLAATFDATDAADDRASAPAGIYRRNKSAIALETCEITSARSNGGNEDGLVSDSRFFIGFCIHGRRRNAPQLVQWPQAFQEYAACTGMAEAHGESYISAFCFGDEFRGRFTASGSACGYAGECWSPWLWLEVDRNEIDDAMAATRRLAGHLMDRFGFAGDELLIFFSGSTGYQLGLPTSLWLPQPTDRFHDYSRRFAESVAKATGVTVDLGAYGRVRTIQAPNGRHPETGRYKRSLTLSELMSLPCSQHLELAAKPFPFLVPEPSRPSATACRDWKAAVEYVDAHRSALSSMIDRGITATALNDMAAAIHRRNSKVGRLRRAPSSSTVNGGRPLVTMESASALLSDPSLSSGLLRSDDGINRRGPI